jgi:transposase
MGGSRRQYEPEFKAEAVRLVGQGRPVAEIARNLGIHVNTLHTWVRELPAADGTKRSRPHRNEDADRIRRLERELRMVKEERDLLKKAAAYFASERRRGSTL